MKRIYYLLAFITAIAVFSACNPLKQTYDQLGDVPKPTAPAAPPIAVTITLGSSDYASSSVTYAKTTGSFKTKDDAISGIPSILAAKYPTAADKSTASVTYGLTNPSFAPADSLLANVSYTVTSADYTASAGVTLTTFKDYSDAQVLLFLKYKYPAPVNNQLVLLTYNYYLANVTPSAGIVTTDSFGYINGNWVKLYQLTPAEYTSIGRGTYSEFSTGDDPLVMDGIFNTILKNDPNVMATAKVGDVKYVTYTYYVPKVTTPATPAYTFQRVQPLTFDGTNWTNKPLSQTLNFAKANGVWFSNNVIAYTLAAADYTTISTTSGLGTSDLLADIIKHNNFTINGLTLRWTDVQIAAALASILKSKYPSAVANQKFAVTFATYGGYTSEVANFNYDGTNFVYQPAPDPANYTLTGDDYDVISKANIGSSSAGTNLQTYGDFSLSGASGWTDAQINAGIALILKSRFPNATAGQVTVVTYAYYSGGNKSGPRTFKFDGTNWTAQ